MYDMLIETSEPVVELAERDICWAGRLDAVHAELAQRFSAAVRVDVRRLWARDDAAYYRVNCWGRRPGTFDHYVSRSAFVRVCMTDDGLAVTDLTTE